MDDLRASLARPIQVAELLIKWADEARACRSECQDLRSRIERLSTLLRQAARADLYERPARRILADTELALHKAASLLARCCYGRGRGRALLHRAFTVIPARSFRKARHLLDNSLGNLDWILRVSAAAASDESSSSENEHDEDHIDLPPIARNEPILFLIWEQIAVLQFGGLEARADAAASVVSLARNNDRYGKLIIEEDGVPPLLRLIREGRADAQESAALAIGLLGRDPECVDLMILAGVCASFAKILKDAPMKVQGMVAWAVSELAANHPKCQDAFLQHNAVRLLVSHLAFETVQEHSKYAIASSKLSIHSVVMDKKTTTDTTHDPPPDDAAAKPAAMGSSSSAASAAPAGHSSTRPCRLQHNASMSAASTRGREHEDPEIKAYLKSHAARALRTLATGNAAICKNITESRALLCFSILLERATGDLQYNAAMALVEICRVAEENPELRRSAFKPTSPSARAVVDQLIRVVDRGGHDDDLLVPCITCLGCLSRTFRATETRVIGPLVRLLDEREAEVSLEAAVALAKFACADNYLHVEHCRAIIAHGGAKHLVQHVYFGDQQGVQTAALVLVCYLAHTVPDSEELEQAEILTVLEWAMKQGYTSQDPVIESLLPEAKIRMELYQSRLAKGGYY
ncbi:unnamed protein product [Urochloa humidicola]